jgi:hypothetical protein
MGARMNWLASEHATAPKWLMHCRFSGRAKTCPHGIHCDTDGSLPLGVSPNTVGQETVKCLL